MALRRERLVERLEELRERHGLSQEDAARKVGITHRQWQRWESGDSTPYPSSLSKIASAFGITVAEFFDEEGLPPAKTPDPQLDRLEDMLNALLAGQAEAAVRLARIEEAVTALGTKGRPDTGEAESGR